MRIDLEEWRKAGLAGSDPRSEAKVTGEVQEPIATADNDVFSPDFRSVMDPCFRSAAIENALPGAVQDINDEDKGR